MPSQRHHEPGDLYVKFHVIFPDHLDPNAVPLLEKALPPRKDIEKYAKNVAIEEVDLSEVDTRSRQAMDEDEMEEHGEGEPRVQCAGQ